MQSANRKYGWKRDKPDARDFMYKITAPLPVQEIINLTPKFTPAYNQTTLGSCTGNGNSRCFQFAYMMCFGKDFMPSRLALYWLERFIEGTVNEDSGAQIRDGIKVMNKYGVCPESMWPYDVDKFTDKPTPECFTEMLNNRAVGYQRIDNADLNAILQCLASGYPIVFGFNVYSALESAKVAKTGILNMPTAKEQLLGGHCAVIAGSNLKTKRFLICNSWGPEWGQKGYFTIPFEYLTNPELASDFWTIRIVT
jgi:C1A family cysteine protease